MQSELRTVSKQLPSEARACFDASQALSDLVVEPRSFAPRLGYERTLLAGLEDLPATATLRDVVEHLLGERPRGHSQTYANVVLTQRALLRLAQAATGRPFGEWEPEP